MLAFLLGRWIGTGLMVKFRPQDMLLVYAMKTLDGGRIGIAAQALGIAQGAINETVKYSKERKQFGKSIAAFQNTQFQMADLETKTQAARLLVRQAAYKKDAGLPYTVDAAMAKLFAAETAMEVTNKAVQFHGGYGYTREYRDWETLESQKPTRKKPWRNGTAQWQKPK